MPGRKEGRARAFEGAVLEGYGEIMVRKALVFAFALSSVASGQEIPAEERGRVDAAIPACAPVSPAGPRKLLIFDLNVGYGGHRSIPYANYAIEAMGRKTGAYDVAISRDPAVFRRESLAEFDAVLLNNTVGNLFDDQGLRESLRQFIYAGGGLLGYHGSSVAFQRWPGAHETWPEFARILGARGCAHREPNELVVVRNEEPGHPLAAPFGGKGFELADEFFRFTDPYSRDRLRVLLSFDPAKTDMDQGRSFGGIAREDNDYAVCWIKGYGRGRVFYSSFGHNPDVFWNPTLLLFWLHAIQFAVGDLPAGTTPSNKLTAARRAQEVLGWHLAASASSLDGATLFEAIAKAASLGIRELEALSSRAVGPGIGQPLVPGLSGDALAAIRDALYAADVRLVSLRLHTIPSEAGAWRGLFEFGRLLGIETLVAAPPREALDAVEALAREYKITVAIAAGGTAGLRHPSQVLEACAGRSRWIGSYVDTASLIQAGCDPLAAIELLGDRVVSVGLDAAANGVRPGSDAGKTEALIAGIHRLRLRPCLFLLDLSGRSEHGLSALSACASRFNGVTVRLAGSP